MYSHPCSPKTFTQHQLFAILALKEHQRCEESAKKKGPEKQAKNNQAKTNKKSTFPKLSLLCDCLSHLTLSFHADRGPWPDYEYFEPLLDDACRIATILRLLCDAGYDS